jgi:GntR family transcriptional repressor for pyruvate dehydrogenase complex
MARRTRALPEKIAQDMMRRILGGEFAETGMLPSERALQDGYNVSRTVVREAVKLLAARGLVTTGNGQGAVVNTNLTASAIDALLLAFHRAHVRLEDLLNVRLVLEPPIAALAAQHATPLQIRHLHELTREMAALAHVGHPVRAATYSSDVNARFHTLVAQASQNPALAILIEMLVGMLWRHQNTVDVRQPPERYIATAEQHARIVEAIERRDTAQAQAAMAEHLAITRERLVDAPDTLRALTQTLFIDQLTDGAGAEPAALEEWPRRSVSGHPPA